MVHSGLAYGQIGTPSSQVGCLGSAAEHGPSDAAVACGYLADPLAYHSGMYRPHPRHLAPPAIEQPRPQTAAPVERHEVLAQLGVGSFVTNDIDGAARWDSLHRCLVLVSQHFVHRVERGAPADVCVPRGITQLGEFRGGRQYPGSVVGCPLLVEQCQPLAVDGPHGDGRFAVGVQMLVEHCPKIFPERARRACAASSAK